MDNAFQKYQESLRDYTASIDAAVKESSIKILQARKHFGNGINHYKKALSHFEKALNHLENIKGGSDCGQSKNTK